MTAIDVTEHDPDSLGSAWAQTRALSRRAVLAVLRKPAALFPGLMFPLLMAAVYTAQFDRVTSMPGFPEVDSFLQFILPAAIMQGVAFGSTIGGVEMALDIETGFFDRLAATPVSRSSIFLARVAGSGAFAGLEAVILMAVFLVFGANIESGLPGIIAILLIAVGLAVALGGFGLAIALRTGSSEVVQGVFPLVFTMVFVSSAFFPTTLMKGWYRAVAEANPMTTVIDATRELVITGWSWAEVAKATGVVVAMAAFSLGVAFTQYRSRLGQS